MTTAPARTLEVPVSGGRMRVARWGSGSGPVVLALHGITATHMAWLVVAAQLRDLTLLAPDLRGRGRSAHLPGPYGFGAHAEDMVALLDALGRERVVVVGHSMGGFVAVTLAGRCPDRVSRLVLVDGGLPTGRPEDQVPSQDLDTLLGPSAARLSMTFASRHDYLDFWRAHPAIGPIWSPEVEAYVDYDLVGEAPGLRSSCVQAAVRTDGAEVLDHAANATALQHVSAPLTFLRATRGLLDGPALYDEDDVARWLGGLPAAAWRTVPDTNHYSVVLAPAGAAAVAQAVLEATGASGDGGSGLAP